MQMAMALLGSNKVAFARPTGGRAVRKRLKPATARALLGRGGHAANSGGGDAVHRLHLFVGAGDGGNTAGSRGPTVADLMQQQQQLISPLPPLPEQDAWLPARPRRHLRRRFVQREADQQQEAQQQAQQQEEAQQQQQQQQQAHAQPRQSASAGAAMDSAAQQSQEQLRVAALRVQQQAELGSQQLREAAIQLQASVAEMQQQLGVEAAQVQAAAADTAADLANSLQQLVLSSGTEAAGLAQAALQQLTARQLSNLERAAAWAQQRLETAASWAPPANAAAAEPAAGSSTRAHAKAQQQQQQQAAAEPQAGLQAVQQRQAEVLGAVQQYAEALEVQAQHVLQTFARLTTRELGSLRQSAAQLRTQLPSGSQAAQPAAQHSSRQQQQAVSRTQAAAPVLRHSRQVAQAVATPSPSAPSTVGGVAPAPSFLAQWGLAIAAAAVAAVLVLLRWLRARRRRARISAQVVREAEEKVRAARLYDRTRQRFQRALLSADQLEGADSSVFNAVGRKGQQAAGPLDGGSGGSGNPFMQQAAATGAAAAGSGEAGLEEAAAAVARAAAAESAADAAGPTDVFDPASWDADTRKQWDAFVARSKVNKGQLWDSSQVDEGLPEVWVDLNRD